MEAKQAIEAWRWKFNESYPHRTLGERMPNEIASEFAVTANSLAKLLLKPPSPGDAGKRGRSGQIHPFTGAGTTPRTDHMANHVSRS